MRNCRELREDLHAKVEIREYKMLGGKRRTSNHPDLFTYKVFYFRSSIESRGGSEDGFNNWRIEALLRHQQGVDSF